ncbi:unnamed protein product [Amoebophrya sp. A25]|nr:unnamed protein product [Amoebophrya sp. A25]|eukprot:GSA25T00023518001.1
MGRRVVRLLSLAGTANAVLKERPVSKVIKLLKDMQTQLETEGEEDQATYKKMGCWCKTTKKDTKASIEANKRCISQSTANIEAATGRKAAAAAEVKALEAAIAENTDALENAKEMRAKELASFSTEEREMIQAIGALKSAVTVLKKHNSFLQTDEKYQQVRNTLVSNMQLMNLKHRGELSDGQQQTIQEFIQQPSFSAYSSQSGEIFGILENMLDTFTADLKESRETEMTAIAQFTAQKKMKEDMIAKDNASLKKEKGKFAEASKSLAENTAKKAECEAGLEADTTTLAEATETCTLADAEFAERTKARAEEMDAVAKALEFLNSDEAHAMFGRALGFLQVENKNLSNVERAQQILRRAGNRFANKELLILAQKVKSNAFAPVILAIDQLVKDITKQMADDVKQKDTCTSEINERTALTTALANDIANLAAAQERLEIKIQGLEQGMKETEEAIEKEEAGLKELSEIRAQENQDYQVALADEKASIKVLKKAEEVLAKVYAPKLLLQSSSDSSSAQPAFKSYEKSGGGNKVLSMIASIIADAEKSAAIRIQNEKAAQSEYEKAVTDANLSIKDKKALHSQLRDEKASAEEDLQEKTEKKKFAIDEKYNEDLQLKQWNADCKFLFDNFASRQEHMTGEIEALNEAKSFLQGMKI